jgi:hypothetical protein
LACFLGDELLAGRHLRVLGLEVDGLGPGRELLGRRPAAAGHLVGREPERAGERRPPADQQLGQPGPGREPFEVVLLFRREVRHTTPKYELATDGHG